MATSNIDAALQRYWKPWTLPFAPSALECAIHNNQHFHNNGYTYDVVKRVLFSAYTDYVTAITSDFQKKLFDLYCGLDSIQPIHVKGCGIINLSKILKSDYGFRLL